MGINVQVCWEKFANYWDVEMRLVPMEGDRFNLSAEEAVELCDENTIGVVAILGSTFDGSYEPVQEICAALDALQERTGLDVPVHVDGASGAFVAPFVDPDLDWDFRLPRVASINASGHKYGLVYPGVGWIVWRDADALPGGPDLLGQLPRRQHADLRARTSRGRARRSWRSTTTSCASASTATARSSGYARDVATRLSAEIAELGPFELITQGDELPVFAFKLTGRGRQLHGLRRLERAARARLAGARVHVPGQPTDLAALRVVVKRGFTHDLADMLVARHRAPAAAPAGASPGPSTTARARAGFHH